MTEQEKQTQDQAIDDLFEKASTDVDLLKPVSSYIRTGRRWDLTHKDVIGDLLVIRRVKDIKTKYGPAKLVDADHQGEEKIILIGGIVLIDQCDDLRPHLPVLAVIQKPARSYVFMDPSEEQIAWYKDNFM